MSNDDEEYKDIERAIATARGDCYIGGLGMGLIANACAQLERVNSVLVVDNNKDVIKLIGPSVKNSKISIKHGDARFDFFNRQYDWMYFDIWVEIDDEAKNLLTECVKNAQPYLRDGGTIEAWLKDRLINDEFWYNFNAKKI
jgi:spermidine synthase